MRGIILASLWLLSLSACAQQNIVMPDDETFLTIDKLMEEKTRYDGQHVRFKARVTRSTDFCFIRLLSGHIRGQTFFWYWGSDDEGYCQANPNLKYGIAIVEGLFLPGVLGRTYSEDGVIDNAKITWLQALTVEEFYSR